MKDPSATSELCYGAFEMINYTDNVCRCDGLDTDGIGGYLLNNKRFSVRVDDGRGVNIIMILDVG